MNSTAPTKVRLIDEAARRAAEALETGEDTGEPDIKQTLLSLINVIDPGATAKAAVNFGAELLKIAIGTSSIAPDKGRNRDNAIKAPY